MASNACWGVEVGSGALKAIKLVRDGDSVTVADFLLVPHKRPLSSPETDEQEARRLAVGTLVSQKDLTKAGLAVSIAGNTGFARFAKLPPVEPKRIPEIVKFEAVQQIPFPIDDVQWDYQTFSQPDSPEVEVGIFAVTTDKVNEKLMKWQDVGYTPSTLTLAPLAVFNAMSYDRQFRAEMEGTILLDIGTMSTDLIVVEGGRVWIRTFPLGGHHFTEALVAGFNLSYAKAERLKREAESSEHARKILQAMRSVFSDLEQDVQRSISYYQSLHKDAKLTKIIGLGATFQLPGLKKFLSQQLKLEVESLDNFQRIKAAGDRNAEFQANAGQFAVAYGLALQGLGLQTLTADLMPVSVIRDAVWKEKTKWFVGAAVLALAAAGAMWIGPIKERSAGGELPAKIAEVKGTASRLKSEWSGVEAQDKPDLRATGVQSLLENRELYGYLMDDVGQMLQAANQVDGKLIFDRLNTDYLGNGVSASADAPASLAGPRGAAPDPNAGADQPPKVRLVLDIRTTKDGDDANKLAYDAFVNWLLSANKKAERANYPYAIVEEKPAEPKFSRGATEVVEDPAKAAANNPGNPGPAPGFRPPGGPLTGGPRGRGAEDGRFPPGLGQGGSMPPIGPPPANPSSGPGGQDPNVIAPIPVQPPAIAPGTKVTKYTITWFVSLKPKADPSKGDGQPKKEGGK